jgi:hypothetical protein
MHNTHGDTHPTTQRPRRGDPGPLAAVLHDLHDIFGERLRAFVAYGDAHATPAASLALIHTIGADDLNRCAARIPSWHRAGCATPLLLTHDEFAGSLDAFPIEYGEILDAHHVLFGTNPFAGLAIHDQDLRHACEVQVKSHLVHLRENYLECGGKPADVAALVADSAPSFALLLRRLARLDGAPATTNAELVTFASSRIRLDARLVGDLLALAKTRGASGVDAMRLYPDYLAAVEALWRFVDQWKAIPTK